MIKDILTLTPFIPEVKIDFFYSVNINMIYILFRRYLIAWESRNTIKRRSKKMPRFRFTLCRSMEDIRNEKSGTFYFAGFFSRPFSVIIQHEPLSSQGSGLSRRKSLR